MKSEVHEIIEEIRQNIHAVQKGLSDMKREWPRVENPNDLEWNRVNRDMKRTKWARKWLRIE